MEVQMDILRSQLQIAQELGKSVIIHCVRAFDQLIQIKKEFPKIDNWCVHGYGRHAVLARQLINQGFYLSLMPSAPLEKYEDLFSAIPHDRIFLETDSMPNVSIEEIYLRVSKLTGLTLPELCKQMNNNAREFFNL